MNKSTLKLIEHNRHEIINEKDKNEMDFENDDKAGSEEEKIS